MHSSYHRWEPDRTQGLARAWLVARVQRDQSEQCLNVESPLGQGLWEGVPLVAVLKEFCDHPSNCRRVNFWGYIDLFFPLLLVEPLSLSCRRVYAFLVGRFRGATDRAPPALR